MEKTTRNFETQNDSAVIVGASLSGLMTGIALAREGVSVIILEKVGEEGRTGSGLQVDGVTFGQSKTEKFLRKIVSGGRKSVQLWSSIESRLRAEAKKYSNIDLRYNTRIEAVDQDDDAAWALTEKGEKFYGDLLIGADGHHSIVRRHVAPDKPDATFAGYMVWLASTDENSLPEELRPSPHHPEVQFLNSFNGFLIGSIIDSGTEPGKKSRRIGCTWYDHSRNDLLRRLGCIEGDVVHHSLSASDIPEKTRNELTRQVAANWPEPWASAMLHALQTGNITGTPIKEYIPERLVKRRIALVGDAAHVPAPITASGFNASLKDAAELGKCVAKGIKGRAATLALEKYESSRLNKVQKMVASGQWYSQSFGRL